MVVNIKRFLFINMTMYGFWINMGMIQRLKIKY